MLLWSWPLSSRNSSQLISPPDISGFWKLLRVDFLGKHIRCGFQVFSFNDFANAGAFPTFCSGALPGDPRQTFLLGAGG